jgi:hypothetical protein
MRDDDLEAPANLGAKRPGDDRTAPWHEFVVAFALLIGIICLVVGIATGGIILYASWVLLGLVVLPYMLVKSFGVFGRALMLGRSYDDYDPRRPDDPRYRDPRNRPR